MYDLPDVMIDRILIFINETMHYSAFKLIWNYTLINTTFFTNDVNLKHTRKEPIKLKVDKYISQNLAPILKRPYIADSVSRLGLEICFDCSKEENQNPHSLVSLTHPFVNDASIIATKLNSLKSLHVNNLKISKTDIYNLMKVISEKCMELQTVLLQTTDWYNENKVKEITQGCQAINNAVEQDVNKNSRKRKHIEDFCSDHQAKTKAIESIPDKITQELEESFGTKMMIIVHQCETTKIGKTKDNGKLRHAFSLFRHTALKLKAPTKFVARLRIMEENMKGVEQLIDKYMMVAEEDCEVVQSFLIEQN